MRKLARWALAPRQYARSSYFNSRLLQGLSGVVLDVGCGGFATKFAFPADVQYYGLDIAQRATHIQGDAHVLPIRDGAADWVLLVAVLEHVEEPSRVLTETKRVLKPGGRLYVAVPFLQMEHAAHDYWRWTGQGVRRLLAAHGFELLDSGTNGGVLVMLDYLLWHALRQATKRRSYATLLALLALKLVVQPLALLERPVDDPLFATSFHLLARRTA